MDELYLYHPNHVWSLSVLGPFLLIIILSFFIKLSAAFRKNCKSDILKVLKYVKPECLVGSKIFCCCVGAPKDIFLRVQTRAESIAESYPFFGDFCNSSRLHMSIFLHGVIQEYELSEF
jgi:hypothetical protein